MQTLFSVTQWISGLFIHKSGLLPKKTSAQLWGGCISLLILSGCSAIAGLPPHIAKELTPSDNSTNNYLPKESKKL